MPDRPVGSGLPAFEEIELNFFEEKLGPYLPPINTVTFYEGDPPASFLSQRVAEVVEANPWLAGRLRENASGRMIVEVPSSIDPTHHFCEAYIPGLKHDMDMKKELLPKLTPFTIGTSEKTLFKVALLRTAPSRFALLVSFHHTIGDAHTFYLVNAMLSASNDVTALDPKRLLSYTQESLASTFGEMKIKGMFSFASLIGAAIVPMIVAPFRRAPIYTMRLVNQEWMAEQRKLSKLALTEQAQPQVPFVSTNDILTSWFLRNGGFNTGQMAANLRNRIPGFTDAHVGNYTFGVHYFPSQFATPEGIRKPLVNGAKTGQLRTSRHEYLSFTDKLAQKPGFVTNWSSFFQEVDLPECKQTFHMPLVRAVHGAQMCIFQATKDRLGVCMIGDSNCIARVLEAEGGAAVDALA